jgi:DNA invertase Pin-like site-specific DNA recombinase
VCSLLLFHTQLDTSDPDGTYDPRLVNDRLLLGLKGTMSEYELSLLRQRGIAARDSKALRGELRFILPPGYCWNEIGQIEMDPDEGIGGISEQTSRACQSGTAISAP